MKRSAIHYKDMPALRRRAIDLSKSGGKPAQICTELSVARSTVWRWLKLEAQSREDTLSKPMGRPRLLSDDDRARVVQALLLGPEANGFNTPLWTLQRITEVIQRLSGVTYNSNYVATLLHGLGWSCQKPERRAKERNEEAIDHWVKNDWPAIKKNVSTWAPR